MLSFSLVSKSAPQCNDAPQRTMICRRICPENWQKAEVWLLVHITVESNRREWRVLPGAFQTWEIRHEKKTTLSELFTLWRSVFVVGVMSWLRCGHLPHRSHMATWPRGIFLCKPTQVFVDAAITVWDYPFLWSPNTSGYWDLTGLILSTYCTAGMSNERK